MKRALRVILNLIVFTVVMITLGVVGFLFTPLLIVVGVIALGIGIKYVREFFKD